MGTGNGLITGTFFSVFKVILLALLIFEIFAFVDAVIRPASAYEAAGKLIKVVWLLFLGIAAFYDFLWGGVTSILTILGTVAAIVYVVDVRPALRQISPRRGNKTGSQNGPYGPW
ncbi:MAG TPA: DUF2516 family protein [Actinocrinis sp.]|uniref:DUF2516 family protein n=1 Tax=Actinocrinis sp. TaxID=1920516 RepID=UPI002DDCF8B0|nr:DUF2516 family protein [Actinocrinis sp.]HEV2343426.1 DUF2516 family protein [Actinocrinis sp.]